MRNHKAKWLVAMGCMLVVAAVAVFSIHSKDGTPDPVGLSGGSASAPTGPDESTVRNSNPPQRDRRPLPRQATDNQATAALRAHLAADDLSAVHEQLTSLANARQLGSVAGLLKTWCREERLEIVQWCLVCAQESDSDLYLALCAETLSNPSDVMREIAVTQLEGISGIRFPDAVQAKAWVSSQPTR